MITELVSRIIILLVGVLYPAYSSFKAVKLKDHRQYTTWMMYWIVFALFLTMETFTDIILSWAPFYFEAKILVVLWLALPYTEGAKSLYRRLIHRYLVEREEKIDEILNNAGQAGFGMVKKASTVVMNHASSGIVSAAMKISKASAPEDEFGYPIHRNQTDQTDQTVEDFQVTVEEDPSNKKTY